MRQYTEEEGKSLFSDRDHQTEDPQNIKTKERHLPHTISLSRKKKKTKPFKKGGRPNFLYDQDHLIKIIKHQEKEKQSSPISKKKRRRKTFLFWLRSSNKKILKHQGKRKFLSSQKQRTNIFPFWLRSPNKRFSNIKEKKRKSFLQPRPKYRLSNIKKRRIS